MNTNDLRQKSVEELRKELVELAREKFNLLMQKGSDEGARVHLFRKVRRDVARVKTIINEKERQA